MIAASPAIFRRNGAVPPPPDPGGGTYGTLIYSNGFNSGNDLDPFGHGQLGNGVFSSAQKVEGSNSFYSIPQGGVSNGFRSEVQLNTEQTPIIGVVEVYVRYEVIVQDNCHSFQWHPETGGGSASPGLWHVAGKFEWKNWIGGNNISHPTGITIQTNRWYYMRMHHKFITSAGANDGYFQHYIDDALAVSWTGKVGDGSGQFMKIGFNCFNSSVCGNSRIYYDNLKIWVP